MQNGKTLVIRNKNDAHDYFWLFADYSQLLLCKIFESTISSGSPTGFGMFIVVGLLALLQQPYEDYMQNVNPIFNRLLGYVTVALAVRWRPCVMTIFP